jgi:hypothetical protein
MWELDIKSTTKRSSNESNYTKTDRLRDYKTADGLISRHLPNAEGRVVADFPFPSSAGAQRRNRTSAALGRNRSIAPCAGAVAAATVTRGSPNFARGSRGIPPPKPPRTWSRVDLGPPPSCCLRRRRRQRRRSPGHPARPPATARYPLKWNESKWYSKKWNESKWW